MRIGCSGWNYASWKETFYPPRLPARRWLEHYATQFDTVEVNATFYRLASPSAVDGWVHHTPPDFVFAVKSVRYLTHMKRLTDMDRGVEPLLRVDRAAGRVAEARPGAVAAARPLRARRRAARARAREPAARAATRSSCATRAGSPSRCGSCCAQHGAAFVLHDDKRRRETPEVADRRLHLPALPLRPPRPPRQLLRAELREWAARVRALAREADVFAYFNNDWEVFAPRNAERLRALSKLDGSPRGGAAR